VSLQACNYHCCKKPWKHSPSPPLWQPPPTQCSLWARCCSKCLYMCVSISVYICVSIICVCVYTQIYIYMYTQNSVTPQTYQIYTITVSLSQLGNCCGLNVTQIMCWKVNPQIHMLMIFGPLEGS
jgi:hypothetical protein